MYVWCTVESGTEKRLNRQCHAQAHDETAAMGRSNEQNKWGVDGSRARVNE